MFRASIFALCLLLSTVGAFAQQQVSGTITLRVDAAPDAGPADQVVSGNDYVQVFIDGVAFGPRLTTFPATLNFDTKTVSNGNHTITATTTDKAGNVSLPSSLTVAVLNLNPDTTPPAPPTITIISPVAGATVRGQTPIAATATDPDGVRLMDVVINGSVRCPTTGGSLSCRVNFPPGQAGQLIPLVYRATDNTGLQATNTISVMVGR